MIYFVQFHWSWLLGAAFIGLATGWVAVVQRAATGLSKRGLQVAAALFIIVIALAFSELVPGRYGYWLDLGLVMLLVFLCCSAAGSWLRERVIWR